MPARLIPALLTFGLLTGCASQTARSEAADTTPAGADALADAKPDAAPVACGPSDDTLRINQIQLLGTHNSYHVAKDKPLDPSHAYTHPPLDVQLNEQGVRQFELDLHRNPGQPFEVFHLPALDPLSTCKRLQDCLGTIRQWSDAHPCHAPLFILFEPKDELDETKLAGQWDDLDAELLQAFPRARIVTPDDVRGARPNLSTAIQQDGWPTLAKTRGKVAFVLINKVVEEVDYGLDYKKGHAQMAGRLMFLFGEPGDPDIGFVKRDNPVDDSDAAALAQQGYIIRGTTEGDGPDHGAADVQRRDAVLACAQLVSTDWPAPATDGWQVALPGGTPARCHPLTAPKDCTATAVEHLP